MPSRTAAGGPAGAWMTGCTRPRGGDNRITRDAGAASQAPEAPGVGRRTATGHRRTGNGGRRPTGRPRVPVPRDASCPLESAPTMPAPLGKEPALSTATLDHLDLLEQQSVYIF